MNGAEQVARFTAVSRVEKRLDDLELVVTELAKDLVKHGEQVTDDLAVFNERLRLFHEAEAARLDAADMVLDRQHAAFVGLTLGSRLRWLLTGRV